MNARIAIIVLAIAGYAAIAHIFSTTAHFSFPLAWIFFVQDSALNLSLALMFGASLRADNIPLCSRIALSVQDDVSEQALRYTRAVTWVWTLFFCAMLMISALLFFFCARTTWSLFANVLYWPLLISIFVLEYLVRIVWLPRADRAGFFATLRAVGRFHRTQRKYASSAT